MSSGEERGLLSRTAADNQAYVEVSSVLTVKLTSGKEIFT